MLYLACFPVLTLTRLRHDGPNVKLQPGQVGAAAGQRQWIGLSITGDQVTISPLELPPAELFLESIDLEVGFWKKTLEVAEQYSADEMAKNFIRAYSGQVFCTDQTLIFDFHGQNLRAIVKGVRVIELPQEQRRSRTPVGSLNFGVLMERTDIAIMRAPDSRIKIKTSSKKYALLQDISDSPHFHF